jgi:cell division protein FtsQ
MSARAARGATPRKAGKSRASGRGRSGRARPVGFGEAVRRVSGWIFLALLAALVLAVIAELRIPQLIGTKTGEAIGRAGFSVRGWEIKGLHHMERSRVDEIVKLELRRVQAQPLVDLDSIRGALLKVGWVQDARVSRRLPDKLVIDIVERQPRAIWQSHGLLTLIDSEGVLLDHVNLDSMPNLPLIVGPDANLHTGELTRLVDATPRLKPVMKAATWVGGRRWDIQFQTGEVLALPEGEVAAQRALASFAEQDQQAQLLGRGIVRFDMRIPGKLIARVSTEPGGGIAPPVPPPADAAPAGSAPAGRKPNGAKPNGAVDPSKTI